MTHATIQTALVTGGNGFMGHHLVKALTDAGIEVRVFHLEGTKTSNVEGIASQLIPGDIRNPESLREACLGVDVVFHLAAVVIDWGPESLFQQVNVEGTRHVLDAAIRAGCQRFVHMSSLAVHRYENIHDGDEQRPTDATTPAYAKSKRDAEDVVLARKDEIEVVIVRPGLLPFGPGDPHNIALLLSSIERGIFGYIDSGKARFCTSYVDNLVAGLVLVATHPKAAGETLILCDDEAISWRQFGTWMAEALECRPPWLSLPSWFAIPIAWCMESIWGLLGIKTAPPLTRYRLRVARFQLVFHNQKARALVGYEPKIGLREGIERTARWYREWQTEEKSR